MAGTSAAGRGASITTTCGTKIYYKLFGAPADGYGPKVVMIMGLAASHEAWAPQLPDAPHAGPTLPELYLEAADALARTDAAPLDEAAARHLDVAPVYRGLSLCALDNRGVGRSGVPAAKSAYSTSVMARDALAVMDALGWYDAHLVGHSMGAMIAAKLAALEPTRVRSLACLGVSGGGWECVPPLSSLPVALQFVRATSVPARAAVDLQCHFTAQWLEQPMPDGQRRRAHLLAEYINNSSGRSKPDEEEQQQQQQQHAGGPAKASERHAGGPGEAGPSAPGAEVTSTSSSSAAAAVAATRHDDLQEIELMITASSTTSAADRPRIGETDVSAAESASPHPAVGRTLLERGAGGSARGTAAAPASELAQTAAGLDGQAHACWHHAITPAEARLIRSRGFPVLVVHGTEDRIAAVSHGARMARRLRARWLPLVAAHMVQREAASEVNTALAQLIAAGERIKQHGDLGLPRPAVAPLHNPGDARPRGCWCPAPSARSCASCCGGAQTRGLGTDTEDLAVDDFEAECCTVPVAGCAIS